MLQFLEALLASTLDAAPAVVLAAVGATYSERSGVVNVGVEGMMRAGAFTAAVASLALPTPLGVLCGALAGVAVALIHAFLCLRLKADHVVSGIALNLVMLALGTFLLEALFRPTGTDPITQLARVPLPLLGDIPLVRAFDERSLFTWLALVAAVLTHLLFKRTVFGLHLRAAGDKPQALAVAGLRVQWIRVVAVGISGALAGLGGAALSTGVLNRFEQHMPAGLGFMAVAAMVFGRWTPLGAAGAALFFAFGNALRISLMTSAPDWLAFVPGGIWLALPYALTLVVLASQRRGAGAPLALGQHFEVSARV